jgi:hypothetical protein
MTGMILDTQKMVDRLEEAGVPPAQARAHAALLVDVISSVDGHSTERYATKDNVSRAVDELRANADSNLVEIKAEFVAVRAEMQAGLDRLRTELTKWVLTVVLAVGILQSALISALLLKLIG